MVTPHEVTALLDRVLVDAAGEKVGTVTEVYLDDQTGDPSWITVRTGWFGTKESFVPLDQVNTVEPVLRTSYDTATIKGAPPLRRRPTTVTTGGASAVLVLRSERSGQPGPEQRRTGHRRHRRPAPRQRPGSGAQPAPAAEARDHGAANGDRSPVPPSGPDRADPAHRGRPRDRRARELHRTGICGRAARGTPCDHHRSRCGGTSPDHRRPGNPLVTRTRTAVNPTTATTGIGRTRG